MYILARTFQTLTFSFNEVEYFYFLKKSHTKKVDFFFNFVHLNNRNFRHIPSKNISFVQKLELILD